MLSILRFACLGGILYAVSAMSVKKVPNNGPTSGRYIVKIKDHVPVEPANLGLSSPVVHTYHDVFHGFVVDGPEDLDQLLSNPDVESIDEDAIVTIDETQSDAPWGLARISSDTTFPYTSETDLSFEYTYDSAGPVDVYVVDTGVYVDHNDFGGRAKWGIAIDPYLEVDDNGHGTHCAGTVAGTRFGVAKSANIIAVKALNGRGTGFNSDVVAALEWIYGTIASSNSTIPSIVSMSIGSPANDGVDDAVRTLISAGIHVVVSAGNRHMDAGGNSPARVEEVMTVGATNITDFLASISNFGPVVDIYAPGESVVSAGTSGPESTSTRTGTSMSAPHVAGFIANLIGQGDSGLSPAEMNDKVKGLAQKDVLHDIPEGSHNVFLHQ